MDLFLAFILALVGLGFGSFLNVCISRIPRDESIISPGSHCRRCGSPIRWYHNIPVVSYLLLKGRCADCGTKISIRYPLVELAMAALFVACFAEFGLTWNLLKFSIFGFLLLGLIFMDAETGLLPHEFTYPGIVVGLLFAWLVPGDSSATAFLFQATGLAHTITMRQFSLLDSVLAAAFGAAFFYLIWAIYYLVRKRHGLGFGDIALIAMCGAFLGLKLILFVLFTAPIAGSLYAVPLIFGAYNKGEFADENTMKSKDTSALEMLHTGQIPFGVFLGLSSLFAMFIGEATWKHYVEWISNR